MEFTNTYTLVATRDLDTDRSAKKGKAVNPWAVCHSTMGPEKDEAFEDCVQKVKKKHKIKKSNRSL